MKAKSIITPLLLLFVGGSVAYLIVGETRNNCCAPSSASPVANATVPAAGQPVVAGAAATDPPSEAQQPPEAQQPAEASAQPPADATTSAVASAATPAPQPAGKTIAYYFHSTQRCKTCLAIERQAHEALIEQFPADLASGTLEWHVLNTDEPANEHFIKDYELVASSLVLVNMRDGAQKSWMNLNQVWDLVHDEPAFKRYVAEQTRTYLEQ